MQSILLLQKTDMTFLKQRRETFKELDYFDLLKPEGRPMRDRNVEEEFSQTEEFDSSEQ